jgi:hypothetical protein
LTIREVLGQEERVDRHDDDVLVSMDNQRWLVNPAQHGEAVLRKPRPGTPSVLLIFRNQLDADPKSVAYSGRPVPLRGAYHDRLERWVRDAVDAASSRALCARTSDGEAYGEVVWSWRLDAGVKFLRG